ncbi:hypothetical protein AGMMS49990_05960 [Endomicrobiia bacterium]|nr:hypothetical protein AGMMS49990_05960 [Endomicrobiia bacterium]
MESKTMSTSETSRQLIQAHVVTAEMLGRFILFVDAKPKTIETYTKSLKQFFKYLQDNEILQPQRTNILAYRDYLKTFCKPTTTQSYITAVRLFFQWTHTEGLYANVAEHIKGAKLDRGHKKDYLTSLQAKTVLAAITRLT